MTAFLGGERGRLWRNFRVVCDGEVSSEPNHDPQAVTGSERLRFLKGKILMAPKQRYCYSPLLLLQPLPRILFRRSHRELDESMFNQIFMCLDSPPEWLAGTAE